MTITNPEPELDYWICDVIKQETNSDLVVLPNKILTDSILFKTDTLINIKLDNIEFNLFLSNNLSITNLLPISGFTIIFDSVSNFKIMPNIIKEKYSLITTKSLNHLANATIMDENISEIIIAYLQKSNYISFPKLNRYLYSDLNSSSRSIDEQYNVNRININTATKEQLDSLPGIGPKTAQKIIDYRKDYGSFENIKDVQNVKGIGPKKYEQIKDLITI